MDHLFFSGPVNLISAQKPTLSCCGKVDSLSYNLIFFKAFNMRHTLLVSKAVLLSTLFHTKLDLFVLEGMHALRIGSVHEVDNGGFHVLRILEGPTQLLSKLQLLQA
jgi:hypothetical protein